MIHNMAIVHPKAKIARNVKIGPFSVVGEYVEIGEGTIIGPNVVIDGITKIGTDNEIFQFAAIGAKPQDKKYLGELTTLEIGNKNVVREFCTIHCGTEQGIKNTKIGNENFILNYVHIAHDCVIGSNNVLTNSTALSGHVTIGDYVWLGGFVKVLQHCTIGNYSFIGGDTVVLKDILPYVWVSGINENAKVYGLNLVGLKRNNFSENTIKNLEIAFNIIYKQGLTVQKAILKLQKLVEVCNEVQKMISFLQTSKKGIVR